MELTLLKRLVANMIVDGFERIEVGLAVSKRRRFSVKRQRSSVDILEVQALL